MNTKQKAQYLSSTQSCPFCGEPALERGEYRSTDNDKGIMREIRCTSCDKEFTEFYELVDVDDFEYQGQEPDPNGFEYES